MCLIEHFAQRLFDQALPLAGFKLVLQSIRRPTQDRRRVFDVDRVAASFNSASVGTLRVFTSRMRSGQRD